MTTLPTSFSLSPVKAIVHNVETKNDTEKKTTQFPIATTRGIEKNNPVSDVKLTHLSRRFFWEKSKNDAVEK